MKEFRLQQKQREQQQQELLKRSESDSRQVVTPSMQMTLEAAVSNMQLIETQMLQIAAESNSLRREHSLN